MPVDIKQPLKKVLPYLLKAQQDNLNEADTVQRLILVLQDVLGYSILTDISRETEMKGKYVDIAIRVDGQIRLLVEAKAAGIQKLRERYIEQAELYASRNNYRWVLLTNGVSWNLYHLTFEEGIESELVFTIDLTKDPLDKAAEKLGMLHKLSIKKNEHEQHWNMMKALGAASIGKALFQDEVLKILRREVRRQQGFLIDEEDLATAIYKLFTQEARETMGPLKIRKRAVSTVVPTADKPTAKRGRPRKTSSAGVAAVAVEVVNPALSQPPSAEV